MHDQCLFTNVCTFAQVDSAVDATVHVPISCCKLEANQDRDPGRVDPQNPRPKDETRCQEDAAGRKDGSDYLNGRVRRAVNH